MGRSLDGKPWPGRRCLTLTSALRLRRLHCKGHYGNGSDALGWVG